MLKETNEQFVKNILPSYTFYAEPAIRDEYHTLLQKYYFHGKNEVTQEFFLRFVLYPTFDAGSPGYKNAYNFLINALDERAIAYVNGVLEAQKRADALFLQVQEMENRLFNMSQYSHIIWPENERFRYRAVDPAYRVAWFCSAKPHVNGFINTWSGLGDFEKDTLNEIDPSDFQNWEKSLLERPKNAPTQKGFQWPDFEWPEGYEWAAIDEDGDIYVFQEEPELGATAWYVSYLSECKFVTMVDEDLVKDIWRNSIRHRSSFKA